MWSKICHVETFLHMINVETIFFVPIHADLSQNLLCCHLRCIGAKSILCDIRTFVRRKLIQNLCLWRKKDKYQVWICSFLGGGSGASRWMPCAKAFFFFFLFLYANAPSWVAGNAFRWMFIIKLTAGGCIVCISFFLCDFWLTKFPVMHPPGGPCAEALGTTSKYILHLRLIYLDQLMYDPGRQARCIHLGGLCRIFGHNKQKGRKIVD